MNDTNSSEPATARRTVLLCAFGALCEGIDLQVAGVAAGGIIPEFHPDPAFLTAFFSASTVGLFAGALIGGRLSDRIGRKPVLVASVAAFGLFSLYAAGVSSMRALIFARLLTGVGLGGAIANLVALTTESSSERRRRANVAIVYSAMPFGGSFVSLLNFAIDAQHWRYSFVLGGVLPLLTAALMAIGLRESPEFVRARALACAAPGGAGTAAGFSAIFGGGRALSTALLWASFLLSLLTLYLFVNWLPTLLLSYGLDRHQAALAQAGFNIGGAIVSLLIGLMLDGRHGRSSVAAVFSGLPLLLLVFALAPKQLTVILPLVLLLGCFVNSAQGILYAIAPGFYPTTIRGAGVGAAVAMGRTGSILGPMLAGFLVAGGSTTSQLLLDLVPITLISAICAVVLVRRKSAAGADGRSP